MTGLLQKGLSNPFRLGWFVRESGFSSKRDFYSPGSKSLHFYFTLRAPVATDFLIVPVEESMICLDVSNTFAGCRRQRVVRA